MTYFFHPEAEAEFGEAVRYYDECREGLGLESAEEVQAASIASFGILTLGQGCRPRHVDVL